ncbi:copper resistance protein CopC [Streptomyces sp. RS10V-4]|uniref:copper resistance CopC/CopD family protein n=1 Tax=Streptomyces rhizoryzae TaxID=2932493 RepID=UPI002006429E|nr:copper resistance protein CopC [Streptomyces rhizoryzae]MCK7623292.1 copper resistance protein CopC [Streptomyces rhizoryzae]
MALTGFRPLRLLVVAAVLFGALAAGAAPAAAHAALTGSDPAQGAVVAHAPEQVTLTFSEGVAMGDDSLRVLDPHGKRVDRGTLRNLCSGSVVKYGAGLPPGLPDGTYTVAWQAVSADSHPVSGAFTFSIGAPSSTTAPLPQQEAGGGPVGALYEIARYLAYAGFALLVGGSAFVVACRPAASRVRSVQRLVVRGWAVLTGATVAMLLLRTPYTGSGKLADVLDLGGLQQVLLTKPGAALVSRLLLLAAAALFLAVLFGAYARAQAHGGAGDGAADAAGDGAAGRRRDLGLGLGIGGAVVATGLAATWAMAEHASTGLQPAVAMPADVLHLLAVAGWLGGLAALLVSLYGGPPVERAAVRRFSRVAFGSVLVLVATGTYQSWRQVGSWSALTSTAYGRLLLVKVGLVVVLVAVAGLSRRWTGKLADAGTEAVNSGTDAAKAGTAAAGAVESGAAEPGAAEPGAAVAQDAAGEGSSAARAAVPAAGSAGPDAPVAVADPDPSAASPDAPAAAPDTAPDPAPADPVRAAQLARQRAALATARKKRVRDADPVRRGLRRSVLAEAAIAVVLLAVATALTTTEPARTEAAVRAASAGRSPGANQPRVLTVPFDTGGPGGKGTARLDLDPGHSGGGNELRVRIADPSGRTRDVPEVKVSFTLAAKKLGPLPVALRHTGTGHWSASGVQLPVPGRWQLSLLVRTSDFDQVTETRNVTIN